MIKDLHTKSFIYCGFERERDPKHCEDCSYFNGYVKKDGNIVGVDCLRNEIPALRGVHLTAFKMNGKNYSARYYDEELDGPLSEPEEYCEKCCFSKQLQNGSHICLLRSGIPDDADMDPVNLLNMFMCYEGEIWKETEEED